MTRPTPSRPRKQAAHRSTRPSERSAPTAANPYALNPNPEVVDPRWLLKALGVIVAGAMLCGYLTLCVLFYNAQWQLVLHPSHSTAPLLAATSQPLQPVRFAVDESGTPQLTGWWIPADAGSRYASNTVLYLPSGDGSLAEATSTLANLHAIGINIFAFDYRGYGQSSATRPNQRRMEDDAASAWHYLTATRSLPGSSIVPFGTGVGAALAAELAHQHPEVPAIILRDAKPDLLGDVLADPRTKLLPVRLLFHNRFEIAPTLTALGTPKLLVSASASGTAAIPLAALYRTAADPKYTVFLPTQAPDGALSAALTRFLDQYLTH